MANNIGPEMLEICNHLTQLIAQDFTTSLHGEILTLVTGRGLTDSYTRGNWDMSLYFGCHLLGYNTM